MRPGPVLFAGGSGVVGRAALTWFRKRHPDVPVLVGGRNIQRAHEAARETGATGAVAIDLDRAGIGLDDSSDVSAVIALAPDHALHGLRYAQDQGIPYVSGSTWLAEAGAEMALFAHRPTVPVVLASHWYGGSAMFLALRGAEEFDTLRTIRIGSVLDEQDATGPAATEDMERSEGSAAALALEHGRRVWLAGDAAKGKVQAIDGRVLDADAYAPLDIVSLHAATQADSIRFDLAVSTSSSRRRGGPIAAEVTVELEGEADGRPHESRTTLEFAGGQASLTGLSVVLALPAVLGLDGRTPAQPGIHLPELLSGTDWFLGQLRDAGATIHENL
ncbi:saccharopine dehydrogenase [Streptomyces sp. NPDC058665]|uniref:saccharopine dehydrogenase n=1 Tax=Streptomyces sp. NPDC058665 TaxID=3346586 RepID=UPI00366341A0